MGPLKPSERLTELVECTPRSFYGLGAIERLEEDAKIHVAAIAAFLDEEAERQAKFEADVIERLEKAEAWVKELDHRTTK